MGLSLKNPRAEKLAQEVAKQTGESMTQAIIRALEDRLERLRGRRRAPDLVEEILDISRHCRDLPDVDMRSPDEILGYDRHGTFNENKNGH